MNHYKDKIEEHIKHYLNFKKISIIIPIFNSELYLEDCLNSIINQTLKNIEIICIDDGSTDNSSNILDKYNKIDNRVIIIRQNNKGSGFSRNRGLDISKGKYISFLDSDDKYFNDFILELLFDKASKNKAIICGGGVEFLNTTNNKTLNNTKLFKYEGFMEYANFQACSYYQRFIFNKNFLRRNNLYFPNYMRYQDPPFFIRTMALAKKFYCVKNITFIYRETIKKNYNLKQVIDMYSGLKECLELGERFKLYRIYINMLNILNKDFFMKDAKKFSQNENLRKAILKVIKSINNNIINITNYNFTLNDFYKDILNTK